MALYVKVTATCLVKIQDPIDENSMQELEDNTFLSVDGNELVEENYQFEIQDSN